MFSDFKLALRSLLKTPGFTTVAVLTLAVAIGACTTLFSVIEATVLRALPYSNPDTLVSISGADRDQSVDKSRISVAKADFLRERGDIFADIALFLEDTFTLSHGSTPAIDVVGLQVSDNFLEVLGLTPLRGRFFAAEDNLEGTAATVVISESLWKERFNSDPQIIGHIVRLNHIPTRIIGVLPASAVAAFGQSASFNRTDILVPVSNHTTAIPSALRKILPLYQAIARLAPGVNLHAARIRLDEAVLQFRKAYPAFPEAAHGNTLRALQEQVFGNLQRMLWILGGAVLAVLLIACANLANLYLARVSTRWGDIAVRLSLGAGRRAIARRFFTEAALLSLSGAALGICFSWITIKAVIALAADRVPRAEQIAIDPLVLAFALGLSLFCAVIIALYPVWRASQINIQGELRQASRAMTHGNATKFFRGALVIMQVQLSLVLLTCTGLLALSFHHLQRTDPGFAVESRAFGHVNLPTAKYSTVEATRGFFQRLEEKLRQAPELVAGGAVAGMPLRIGVPTMAYAAEEAPVVPAHERPMASVRIVTPNYFRAMGIRLREGRFFDESDRNGGQAVVIVNETLAKGIFPRESALDKYLLTGDAAKGQGFRIVGIVRDVKSSSLAQSSASEFYIPHAQLPFTFGSMTVVGQAKSGLAASVVIPALRRVLTELDPQLTLSYPQTVDELVSQSIEVQRLTALLLVSFSCVALLLAAVGIYSVVAYSVTQRTNEIGIRMALGAERRQIVDLVLSQGMRLVIIGLAIGLCVAAVTTRLFQSMLYQVEPLDMRVLASMTVFFALIGICACVIPSLRAARIDPLVALRTE